MSPHASFFIHFLFMYTAPLDYISTTQALVFSRTVTTQCVRITIVDDLDLEGTEMFDIVLSTSDPDILLPSPMGVVTILDNDVVSIGLEFSEYSAAEDDGLIEVCVLSERAVQRQLVASVETADGTATGKYTEQEHLKNKIFFEVYMWQSQVENEHYSTVSGLIQLSLECFIEITPDFLCPFMND